MSNRKAVVEKGSPVAKMFGNMIAEIQSKVDASNVQAAVDVELTFNQVSIDSKGIPLFTRNKQQSQMQIKLATRVIPSQ